MADWKGIKTHLKNQMHSDSPELDFMVDQSRPAESKPRQESHRRSDQDCSDWRASPPALRRSCVEFDRYQRRSGDYCAWEDLKFSDIHLKSVNFSLHTGLLAPHSKQTNMTVTRWKIIRLWNVLKIKYNLKSPVLLPSHQKSLSVGLWTLTQCWQAAVSGADRSLNQPPVAFH